MFRIIFYILIFASCHLGQANAFSIFEDGRSQFEIEKRLMKFSSDERLAYKNRVFLESKSDFTIDSNNSADKILRNNVVADITSNIYYNSQWFAIANIRMEEEGVRSNEFRTLQVAPANGNDRFFDNHYVDLRQLLVGMDNGRYKLFAGKFTPKFGYAWQLGRGAYSDYLASSYMQRNRIGLGGELKYGEAKKNGRYNLGLSFYKYDRKYIDNSVLNSYRNVKLTDAEPGAGNDFDSFTVNLDIDFDFKSGRGLFYRFAYSKQNVNDGLMLAKYGNNIDFADQESYSLAMNHKIKLKNNVIIDKLIEYKDGNFTEGIATFKKDNVLTFNVIVRFYNEWSMISSYANRRISNGSGLVVRDSLTDIAAGYDFNKSGYFDGLQLQLGYARSNQKDRSLLFTKDTDSLFGLLRYVKNL